MADVNANIGVNIDTSNALAQLKALQRQISQFHTSIARSSETAGLAQRDLQKNFLNGINAIGSFSAELRTVKTTAESFTDALEKNKFSMREYFRFAGASTKTFGKLFTSEFDTINKVAEQNVKRLQTQYIKMGRDASGAMRAIAIMPNELDMSKMSTQLQMSAQRQALFNQLVKQGSTNLLNFGKNTQWAGRQLMVGFTLPLATLGATASKTFMQMEAAALKFRKVYGDLFTPREETQQALADITALGQMFTKYGVAVSDTVALAAEAAAAGFAGVDLQRQTQQATRLSILGQVENQKALETTISLQNAFKMSSEDLAGAIDFLNAVENQTVVSLDDITTAIPKVAPVIQQLGGDVKDLAFFMAAMKEGGVNASEGANALKSGLAALINPTEKASAFLADMGINIKQIIETNKGDLKSTVIEFAQALDTLEPLTRARAIEQLFGKFQFARLSTLFDNVTNQTGQAARVLDLAGTSIEDLAALSESELGMTADSAMNKFRKSVEDLKMALVPVGETFLQAVTPILEFVGGILEKFNNLSSGVKKAIVVLTVAIGAIGPVALMTFGLLANALANGIKGLMLLRQGYLRLTGQTQVLGEQTDYLTVEQQRAAAVAHSLDQSHARLTQTFNAEAGAIRNLANEYRNALGALQQFAQRNPGMMMPPKKYNKGVVVVPGSGNKDTVPAMLTPGEAVIPADMTKKYGALIDGMIAGNIPGYRTGKGTGTAVDVPGGFAAAHFGGSAYRSGKELLAIVEGLDTAFAKQIRVMVSEVENGLDRVFTVFTNEVVATSTELNRAVGKTGSGKTADIGLARRDLIERGEVRDIELQRQLTNAGVSVEEFKKINKRVTEEIETGFTKLGDITEVTAEDIDKLINEAYDAVAKTDSRVAEARAKMREVTAVTDPRTDSRVALSKDPYFKSRKTGKYFTGMEQVAGPGNVPYQQSARFKITNPMAEQLGLTSANAAAVYSQFSNEVKIRLASLRGDIAKFTAEFQKEAENAGLKTGESYKLGVEKSGLKDIYVESRQRTSPHPLASKDGQDDGTAYEKAREGAVARTRRSASTGVITPGSNFPIEKGGGVPLTQVANAAIISEATKKSADTMVSSAKSFQDRMTGLNRGLMSGTFALGSLSGLASMSGGKLGEFAGTVSKLNLIMFALMSVTQMLTQQQFLKLAADRLMTSGLLAGNVATGKVGIATGLFSGGIKKLLPNLLNFGKIIARILGPIGLAITAITATASVIKGVNAWRERERLAIEGLGDAATLTKDKIKTLGDIFGVIPQTTKFETAGPQAQIAPQQRTQVQAIRENEDFKKQFAKDIASLRQATEQEAALIFDALAVQLKGKGFAKEQIQAIVAALQEESGKTSIKFDFANIDLATDKGMMNFQGTLTKLSQDLGKQFSTGYASEVRSAVSLATGEVVKWTEVNLSKGLKKNLNLTAKAFSGFMNGLSGQLENGTITADQFRSAFGRIGSTIGAMPPPQALLVLDKIFKDLDPTLAQAVVGLDKVSDRMLLLRAQAVGLTANMAYVVSAMKMLADPLSDVSDRVKAEVFLNNWKKALKEAEDAVTKFFDSTKKGTGTGTGGGEKSAFQLAIEQLQKQKTELINTQKAYAKLRAEGVEAGRAFEIASDAILAAAIANDELSTTQWDKLLKLIKGVNKELLNSELLKFFEGRTAEIDLKKQFAEILPLLEKMGLKSDDIKEIFSNPDLARAFIKDLEDGVLNSKELAKYIEQIPEIKRIDIILGIDEDDAEAELQRRADELFGFLERAVQREYKPKITNAEKEVEAAQAAVDKVQAVVDGYERDIESLQRKTELNLSRPIEAFQEQIADLQRNIELNFERPIEQLNEQINSIERQIEISFDRPISGLQADIEAMQRSIELGFERPIAALQEEASDLSNELELMDRAAEEINSKYDAQEEALTRISDINQEIAAQQKSQLSIADALTQGDISAAAQAAQEARAQAAAAASDRASGTIDAARQAQLEALRTRQGMTRVQVEQRQFAISQQVFNLEEQREAVQAQILAKQDQIYALEQARIPVQEKIRIKQDQIYAYQEKQKLAQEQIRIIEDQIYNLEEQREANLIQIRDLEDTVYNIKNESLLTAQNQLKTAQDNLQVIKDELQARLDDIEAQKDAWQAAADATIAAKVLAGEYNDVLEATKAKLASILEYWKQIAAAMAMAMAGGGGGGGGNIVVTPKPKVETKPKVTDPIVKDNTNKVAENTKKITEEIKTLTELRKETTSGTAINFLLKEHIDTLNDTLTTRSAPGMIFDERTKFQAMTAQTQQVQQAQTSNILGTVNTLKSKFANSGGLMRKYYAKGGPSLGSDIVPAMLTPGEFVMSKYAVKNFGIDNMKAVNDGTYSGESVYNYSINVNVKSGANPDEIARSVMTQIKQIDSQRIRGQRV